MDNWKKEWANLKVEESQFLMSHDKKKDNPFYSAMDKVIPEKLQNTIEVAFDKAFEVVFEMGTPVIEKTYDKKKAKGKFYRLHLPPPRRPEGRRARAVGCQR